MSPCNLHQPLVVQAVHFLALIGEKDNNTEENFSLGKKFFLNTCRMRKGEREERRINGS